jgi:SAM-dependent methyltransferase
LAEEFMSSCLLTTNDLDAVETSEHHGELIRRKRFLRKIYEELYEFFLSNLEDVPPGLRIELGSGGGFIREIIPRLFTSDVVPLPGSDLVFSGLSLPFQDCSIAAVMMINVFHHLQDVACFLHEAERTLITGGKILMVEPSHTMFSRFVYSNFHHEPFDPRQEGWALPPGGRMSMANDALPWIVFCRDRGEFEERFSRLRVEMVQNFMPIRYILSGGVSRPQMVPSWSYPIIRAIEVTLSPFSNLLGLFMKIVVRKG